MEEHEDEICKVYNLLSDEKSRFVFENLIRFRLIDESIIIPTEKQDKQYFEYVFFPRIENEIFVDCGAYNGISLRTFLNENCNNFGKYYGIEPDINSYNSLKQFVLSLPDEIRDKIVLLNKSAYNKPTELRLYSIPGPGSFIADIGNQPTKGIRIDDIVDEDGATFIKMNIEGSEIMALQGAENTIREFKPRLAIAGYHKTHDLWQIPLLINQYNNEYSLHLRSYMNNISFVYYAE